MSLQLAAQHLSSQGRGPDDTLVHMSRDEVKSLNDLAMAHGGQLTINPHTGLPEAGFLSAILPAVAGFALNAAVPGLGAAMGGYAIPALVGGASYLMNPKQGLMGGLMAGMGAYGGMNLGEALAKQGMETAATEQLKNNATYQGLKDQLVANVTNPTTEFLPAKTIAEQMAPLRTAAMESVAPQTFTDTLSTMGTGAKSAFTQPGGFTNLYRNLGDTGLSRMSTVASLAAPALVQQTAQPPAPVVDKDMGQRYTYSPGAAQPLPAPDVPTYEDILTKQGNFGRQQNYYPSAGYQQVSADQAKNIYGFAGGGPVEQMSNENAIGANTGFPQAYMHTHAFATPYQTPISQNVLTGTGDVAVDPYTGEQKMADGGISDAGYNLGGYSDGGRLLRGPGDGVSDSIPATIGHKQPARLADGEFVVPARIVSELGNGSTEAGARKLYGMMDRVQAARGKTVGKGRVAKNTRADKYLPA